MYGGGGGGGGGVELSCDGGRRGWGWGCLNFRLIWGGRNLNSVIAEEEGNRVRWVSRKNK